jgi:hypothetical protein
MTPHPDTLVPWNCATTLGGWGLKTFATANNSFVKMIQVEQPPAMTEIHAEKDSNQATYPNNDLPPFHRPNGVKNLAGLPEGRGAPGSYRGATSQAPGAARSTTNVPPNGKLPITNPGGPSASHRDASAQEKLPQRNDVWVVVRLGSARKIFAAVFVAPVPGGRLTPAPGCACLGASSPNVRPSGQHRFFGGWTCR